MSNTTRTPLGPPIQIGQNQGYQILTHTWNGQVRFTAKVGRVFNSRTTGQPGIIGGEFDCFSLDDFRRATAAASKHLTKLQAQTHAQQAAQVQVQIAPTTAPQPGCNSPRQSPQYAPQQPAPNVEWNESQPPYPMPPKPYPSGGGQY